jgi:hypothetical protein
MMCLACEQDGLWLAYLQRRGLITPDGYLVETPPFFPDPIESSPVEDGKKDESAGKPADQSADQAKFSCDDPSGG